VETRVIKLADIKPAPYNPRVQLTPKDQEYKALDASIEENGLVLPLIVNIRDNCLIGGHQRLSVLLAAGETETNAVVVDMPEAQAKALCIALNKLDGEWDYGQLADIIQQLIDDGENLLATGFTQADIDDLLGEIGGELGEDEEPPSLGEEEDEPAGGDDEPAMGTTVVRIGHLHFKVEVPRYKRLVESIRDAGIFDQGEIAQEMKRRLLRHD
jgi:ParB-like chromosome segregation protein Spo0J